MAIEKLFKSYPKHQPPRHHPRSIPQKSYLLFVENGVPSDVKHNESPVSFFYLQKKSRHIHAANQMDQDDSKYESANANWRPLFSR